MKILWITNTVFPEPAKALGLPQPLGGGWMYDLAQQIADDSGKKLAVASITQGKGLTKHEIKGITYYTIRCKQKNIYKYSPELEIFWERICNEYKPNIIHIHGTEYPKALACMRIWNHSKYLISIQGLLSGYSRYIYGGISCLDLIKNITLRDLIRKDTLIQRKNNWEKSGEKYDKEYFNKANGILGRTAWDKAHTFSINPKANYFHCGERLRSSFYEAEKWSLDKCNGYTIFLSQGNTPIKGIHNVIAAVAYLIHDFPLIKVRIAGYDITCRNTIKDKIKLSGYGKYILNLLTKYKLQNKVSFLGPLDEHKMIEEYQKAHIFICPSSIENSPNSLGEAQLIGTPVIASYVGGIPDMVQNGKTGILYRFEEIEMLAEYIKQIFENNKLAKYLSENEIREAERRHDKETIFKELISIYDNFQDD